LTGNGDVPDIILRTTVDLPEEQIRKLTLLCRCERISRAEAIRRAVAGYLRVSPASDLGSFFGVSRSRGNISRQVAVLRDERSFDFNRVRHLVGSIAGSPKHSAKDPCRKHIRQRNWR